jgi:hypothetical protein
MRDLRTGVMDMRPLDPGLNAAILSIASDLFPDGFDVSPKGENP